MDNTVTTSGTAPSSPSMRATAAVPLDGGAETASTAASAISGPRFKA